MSDRDPSEPSTLADRCRALEDENRRLRDQLQRCSTERDELQAFFTHAADGILIGDATGVLIAANPFICDLLGYRAEELLGRHIRVLFPPEVLADKPLRFDLLAQNRVLTSARDMVAKDGARVPIEMRSLRLPDGRHLAFVRDVRERERNLAAVRAAQAESERQVAFQAALLDSFPSPVFWKDAQGRYLGCNQAFTDLMGVTAERIRGRTVYELWPGEHAQVYHRKDLELMAAGGRQLYEWKVRDQHGQDREVVYAKGVFRDETGAVAGLVGSFVDVSALKRVEAALRETTRELETLIANIPGAVYRVETAFPWRVQRASPGMARLTGHPVASFLDGSVQPGGLVLPEDQEPMRRAVDGAVAAGRPFQAEGRIRTAEGAIRHVRMMGQAIQAEGGGPPCLDGIILDITEPRLLEERLRQSEKLTAIGQLAGGIAHDFNNQLTGIMGFADLLLNRLADPVLREYADTIVVAATHAADLTRKLLAFARKGSFQHAPVDVHRLIGEVSDLLAHAIDKRIRLHRRLEAPAALVMGDASQLQNALLNLGLNARDAMPDGGDLTLATAEVDLDAAAALALQPPVAPGRHLRVSVQDTGTGLSADARRHLFEPFFTTKPVGRGTGMGLAAVYGTVTHHHGGIGVRSETGRGTEFALYLPLHRAREDATMAAEPPPALPRAGARILVVDDEPAVRATTCEILRLAGHAVTACPDGQAALDLVHRTEPPFDLVVLDMIMPGLSGLQSFTRLRELQPGLKVVVCTGHKPEDDLQPLLASGAAGFLPKPYRRQDLLAAVATLLGAGAR